MGLWRRLRMAASLRTERQYVIARALRRRGVLRPVADRTAAIRPDDLLMFVTLRNERVRLPYMLDYYRRLGIDHVLAVDNGSSDGSGHWLAQQPDVSLWHTTAGYKAARFGMDWINALLFRHGHGHWCLTVDPDEFLVYPHCDTRPLRALTDWLAASGARAFPAMLIDTYPQGAIDAQGYREGQDPFEVVPWFDPANYTIRRNPRWHNLWIQGGPRARVFFPDAPMQAPALNKIPLVRWERRFAYVSSTHALLPRSLNRVYDVDGGEAPSGCLLHAKFLPQFAQKSAEELDRRQHYANSREYEAYHAALVDEPDLWVPESVRYRGWRQLEQLGLMSAGDWA